MTRIDFYILRSADIRNRQLLACRLTEKAYRLGHTVYPHTRTPSSLAAWETLALSLGESVAAMTTPAPETRSGITEAS